MERFLAAEKRFAEKHQRALDDIKEAMDEFVAEQRRAFQTSTSQVPGQQGGSGLEGWIGSGCGCSRVDRVPRQQGGSGLEAEPLLDHGGTGKDSEAEAFVTPPRARERKSVLDEVMVSSEQCLEHLFHTKTNRTRDITPKRWPQYTLLPLRRTWTWSIFSSLIVLSMCTSLGHEVHCQMKYETCKAYNQTWPCHLLVSREDFEVVTNTKEAPPFCPSDWGTFDDSLSWWTMWKIINSVLFTIELLVRVLAEQWEFYSRVNLMKWWNILDTGLWLVTVLDFMSDAPMIHVIRVGRLCRAMRVFEIFPDLRVMFWSCFACAESLLWAFVILGCFMYMIAIYLMEIALYYLRQNTDGGLLQKRYIKSLAGNWNGIYHSFMSLVYSITGGLDWQPLAEPFHHMGGMGDVHGLIYTGFIAVSTIGLLNIVVGIFVQKANDVGSVSPDSALAQAFLKNADNQRHLKDLFDEFDKSDSERITVHEIKRGLLQHRIRAYFSHLDIDVFDEKLFLDHFDECRDDAVSKDKFVDICQHLQGAARPLREMKRLRDEMKRVQKRRNSVTQL